jgi:DnaJ-class molecular chaperone
MSRDFYAILGVPRDADSQALKKAYRQLALRWHPDKNPNNVEEAQAKFQEISEAYETLNDPEKRAIYDRYGEAGLQRGGGGSAGHSFAHAEDIFRAFFGGGGMSFGFGFPGDDEDFGPFGFPFGPGGFTSFTRVPSGPRPLPPLSINVSCTLEQLFSGAEKSILHTRNRNGTSEETRLKIVVPPGTLDGTEFRCPGEGDIRPGYLPQDVILVAKQVPHGRFERIRDDLRIKLRISLKEAICGVERSVAGIDGQSVPIKTTTIIKPGAQMTVPGAGMVRQRAGGTGDLRVSFEVVFPDRLEPDVKECLEVVLPDLEVS